MLALPHGSHLQKLRHIETIRAYAATNAASWFKYIKEKRGRRLDSLYVVTGCEKAPSWGMATFHSTDDEFDLSFAPMAGSRRYKWTGNPAEKKSHDLSHSISEALWNQATFVHGLTISFGTGVWASIRQTVQIREDTEMDCGPGNARGNSISSSHGSLLSRAMGFFAGGTATDGNNTRSREHVVLSEFPPTSQA